MKLIDFSAKEKLDDHKPIKYNNSSSSSAWATQFDRIRNHKMMQIGKQKDADRFSLNHSLKPISEEDDLITQPSTALSKSTGTIPKSFLNLSTSKIT